MAITSQSKTYKAGAAISAMPTTSQSVGSRIMAFPLCGHPADAVVTITVVTQESHAVQCGAFSSVVHAELAGRFADDPVNVVRGETAGFAVSVGADCLDVSAEVFATTVDQDFVVETVFVAHVNHDAGQSWCGEFAIDKNEVSTEPNLLAIQAVVVAAFVICHAVEVRTLESLGDAFDLAGAWAVGVCNIDAGAASVCAGLDAELDARECFFESSANQFGGLGAREILNV